MSDKIQRNFLFFIAVAGALWSAVRISAMAGRIEGIYTTRVDDIGRRLDRTEVLNGEQDRSISALQGDIKSIEKSISTFSNRLSQFPNDVVKKLEERNAAANR